MKPSDLPEHVQQVSDQNSKFSYTSGPCKYDPLIHCFRYLSMFADDYYGNVQIMGVSIVIFVTYQICIAA